MDFGAYLACDACKAPAGAPCRTRTGGGPQALGDTYALVPHAGRSLNAAHRPATLPGRVAKPAPRPKPAAKPAPAKPGPAKPAVPRAGPAWLKPRRPRRPG